MELKELEWGYFILKREAKEQRDREVTFYVKERTGQIYRMFRTGGTFIRDHSVTFTFSPEEKITSIGYLW